MKKLQIILFLFLSIQMIAQYTSIPDGNFEQYLIDSGVDTGVKDGKVLTSNINTIKSLYIGSRNINDLTGIQDFVNLEILQCYWNKLTTIDLSKNTSLKKLFCNLNQLTSLDLSKNILLTEINCGQNRISSLNISQNENLAILNCSDNQIKTLDFYKNIKITDIDCSGNILTDLNVTKNTLLKSLTTTNNNLTSLDVSNNINLTFFSCYYNIITNLNVNNCIYLDQLNFGSNKLETIDVSQNTLLTSLACYDNLLNKLDISKNTILKVLNCESNKLTTLNLKNGNNKNFQTSPTNFKNNLNLTCIQVDDATYSEVNWFNLKDPTATYNNICQNLSTGDVAIDESSIYPNPTKGQLYINNLILEKITVNNMEGKTVKTITFNYPSANNTIDLSDLIKGVYILKIKSNGIISNQKIIIE